MQIKELEGFYRIGVAGYMSGYDESVAHPLLEEALSIALGSIPDGMRPALISGYTATGIVKAAYAWATKQETPIFTVGIACSHVYDDDADPLWPVDHIVIQGNEWGDESPTFLDNIDVLVRVGGGKQTMAETYEAKRRGIPTLEINIPRTVAAAALSEHELTSGLAANALVECSGLIQGLSNMLDPEGSLASAPDDFKQLAGAALDNLRALSVKLSTQVSSPNSDTTKDKAPDKTKTKTSSGPKAESKAATSNPIVDVYDAYINGGDCGGASSALK